MHVCESVKHTTICTRTDIEQPIPYNRLTMDKKRFIEIEYT